MGSNISCVSENVCENCYFGCFVKVDKDEEYKRDKTEKEEKREWEALVVCVKNAKDVVKNKELEKKSLDMISCAFSAPQKPQSMDMLIRMGFIYSPADKNGLKK